MQGSHQNFDDSCRSPLFVVPVNGRVRWEVLGQVLPVTAILEPIEDAIEDVPLAPLQGACPFLLRQDLRQQGFQNGPFFIGEAAGIWHGALSKGL